MLIQHKQKEEDEEDGVLYLRGLPIPTRLVDVLLQRRESKLVGENQQDKIDEKMEEIQNDSESSQECNSSHVLDIQQQGAAVVETQG